MLINEILQHLGEDDRPIMVDITTEGVILSYYDTSAPCDFRWIDDPNMFCEHTHELTSYDIYEQLLQNGYVVFDESFIFDHYRQSHTYRFRDPSGFSMLNVFITRKNYDEAVLYSLKYGFGIDHK